MFYQLSPWNDWVFKSLTFLKLTAGDETKEHMNINRKYLRPSEVEEIYGIKQGTLTKQRSQGYGLPYVVIGRKPKKRHGGIILYDIDVIEDAFKSKNKVEPYNYEKQ